MLRKLSYVGIAVRDARLAAEQWCDTYGLTVVDEIVSESEGVRSLFLATSDNDEHARIELVEPLDHSDTSNPIARRLIDLGEGVMQLAFDVDDPAGAADRLQDKGIRARVVPSFAPGYGPRALVGPRFANGVLMELV